MRIQVVSSRIAILLLTSLAALIVGGCGNSGSDRDETAPALTVISITRNDGTTPPPPAESPTLNAENYVIAGTVEPGATVEVTIDTTAAQDRQIDLVPGLPAGEWRSTEFSLQPGSNVISAKATDPAGNTRTIQATLVLADVLLSPANGDTGVAPGAPITATFRGDLNLTTPLPAGSFRLFLASDTSMTDLAAPGPLDPITNQVQLIPDPPHLIAGTTYRIVLSPASAKIKTTDGREIAETTATFTTDAAAAQ